ncbi:hypothetical protein KHA96_08915 [Bacillus sp. FJAT-49711]|uniref:hypothetical protein n=1 Tax=Bacillus sp. FJAT-49711 TaxID=2833585 RepID=UPI001BCA5A1A|nr:hypothetical protein [Bacillus sp. FJAT-49711]MBS4218430.1 hypothetical protein [Bacillus sp. FJAT-49711]
MRKLKYWGWAVLIGLLLIGAAIWVATSGILNKSDIFVYKNHGELYWFELTGGKEKVKGTFHKRVIIDEIGEEPFIEEKEYPIIGKKNEKGYELRATNREETMKIDAAFSGKNLIVQEQSGSDEKLYESIEKEKFAEYEEELQAELQVAIDGSEEKFKSFIREFFSKLNSVYGYLYSAEDESFQLFLKIDEALLQGEVSGSLLMMNDSGKENNPYEETTYEVNGITDGQMLELFTTVDGKKTKLEGNFIEDASQFNLSFWKTDQKLTFNEVTEAEFKESYEEFKAKVQNSKKD